MMKTSGFKITSTSAFWIFVVAVSHLNLVSCRIGKKTTSIGRRRRAEQGILNSILNSSSSAFYDLRVSPGPGDNTTFDGPTLVNVSCTVVNIYTVDYTLEEMKIQLTVQQSWIDSRLSYSPNDDYKIYTVTLKEMEKIWTPDLFVVNTKDREGANTKPLITSQPNSYVQIFPNGRVVASQKNTFNIDCPMNFKKFPMDTQNCEIRLKSFFGLTNDDVAFTWETAKPVQMLPTASVQGYKFKGFTTDNCDSNISTGPSPCLKTTLSFKRQMRFYKVQIFIPCAILVLISWLGFWLPPQQIIPRLILSLASIFVAATQTSRMNEHAPQVSYTMAIDIWSGFSLAFLLVALVETILVFYLFIRSEHEFIHGNGDVSSFQYHPHHPHSYNSATNKYLRLRTTSIASEVIEEDVEAGTETTRERLLRINSQAANNTESARIRIWSWLKNRFDINQQNLPHKIDIGLRIVYPFIFVFFAIVFFSVYGSTD